MDWPAGVTHPRAAFFSEARVIVVAVWRKEKNSPQFFPTNVKKRRRKKSFSFYLSAPECSVEKQAGKKWCDWLLSVYMFHFISFFFFQSKRFDVNQQLVKIQLLLLITDTVVLQLLFIFYCFSTTVTFMELFLIDLKRKKRFLCFAIEHRSAVWSICQLSITV